jgi:hypothetical protein
MQKNGDWTPGHALFILTAVFGSFTALAHIKRFVSSLLDQLD